MVIGGMHLGSARDEEIYNVMDMMNKMSVEYAIPMHCSGIRAASIASMIFKEKCIEGKTGLSISIKNNVIAWE